MLKNKYMINIYNLDDKLKIINWNWLKTQIDILKSIIDNQKRQTIVLQLLKRCSSFYYRLEYIKILDYKVQRYYMEELIEKINILDN